MNQTACPPRDEIASYILGTVDDGRQAAVEAHLSDCSHCSGVADELDSSASDRLMELLRQSPPADDFSSEKECGAALSKAREIGASGSRPSGTSREADTEDKLPLPCHLGEYQLVEHVGGNMGHVYKAWQTTLDRYVAVKVLPETAVADETSSVRFQQEMKLVGPLDHRNVVRALDARQIDGKHVFVMEFVEGESLSRLLRLQGPLPLADACEVVRQAAVGLQYVHEKGLVHRDIKPSNLMLTPQGEVKILDLGLARLRAPRDDVRELTAAGHVVGTPGYMAPEQVAGSPTVDTRADVYGLGCTLFKLLTGRAPYDDPERPRNAAAVMRAHQSEPPPPLKQIQADVPDALAGIVERMLAKSPADRYQTPGQVADALEPFAVGSDLPALAEGWERRRRSGDTSVVPVAGVKPPSLGLWKFVAAVAVVALAAVGLKMGFDRLGDAGGRGGEPPLGRQMAETDEMLRQVSPSQWEDVEDASNPNPEGAEGAGDTEEVTPKTAAEMAAGQANQDASGPTDSPEGQEPPGRQPPVLAGNRPPQASSSPEGDWLADAGNEQASFAVDVDVDHADRIYRGPPAGADGQGEVMHVTVKSSQEGYLYLIYRSVDGSLKCLYPNKARRDNKIAAGREIVVPHPDARFRLRTGPPYGKELLKAVVTLSPREPEDFGVRSFTEGNVTPLKPAAVKSMFVELENDPADWAEKKVEITTMPGEPDEPADTSGNDLSEPTWRDGFLENEYAEPEEKLSEALDAMFGKCVAVETTILEDEQGTVESWGVGDKTGKYGRWSGVGTIEQLNIKDGGVVVAVKKVRKPNAVIIGFKVAEGDKAASEILHEALAKRLQNAGPEPTADSKQSQAAADTSGKSEREPIRNLKGLEGFRLPDGSLLITAGFPYDKDFRLQIPFVVDVEASADLETLRFSQVLMAEKVSENGKYAARPANACVGCVWQFKNTPTQFRVGDYVYTAFQKDSTVSFNEEGVLLTGFKIMPVSEFEEAQRD